MGSMGVSVGNTSDVATGRFWWEELLITNDWEFPIGIQAGSLDSAVTTESFRSEALLQRGSGRGAGGGWAPDCG